MTHSLIDRPGPRNQSEAQGMLANASVSTVLIELSTFLTSRHWCSPRIRLSSWTAPTRHQQLHRGKGGGRTSFPSIVCGQEADFNKIHFFLLGNRFRTLYLPSLIVLVEGKTDHAFINKVLSLRFPNHQLSIINATSDSRIKEITSVARSILTDIQRSPYRDRIIAVLDSVHGAGLRDSLTAMGLLP